eukprot:NODE_10090_length_346_cov_40.959596_g9180_i0.p2 GENE.NODE_10090_length_346_cov_40.959596_g9180_i0~~NODE_10090_length_346_cov_40.959596_g9180_i0.p2  ORF type:complete len:72 (+),score=10.66 NODE_10090_length_346_cov_40.959596_g9180_i0:81-296(+)
MGPHLVFVLVFVFGSAGALRLHECVLKGRQTDHSSSTSVPTTVRTSTARGSCITRRVPSSCASGATGLGGW